MKANSLTGIIPFTYFFDLPPASGSTFLRAVCLANNSADFEIWKHGKKYDQLIFQKAYWPEMMKLFSGPKILDLCDPDWIPGYMDLMQNGQFVDAITCSSKELKNLITQYFPDKKVYHVPDRLDFSLLPPKRPFHTGLAKKVVWFGFISNAHELLPIFAPTIKKHNLVLTIVAEKPYSQDDEVKALNPGFIKYDQASAYALISGFDISLNPRSNKALFKYKSNNKSLISWALGVPVSHTENELDLLMDATERNNQIESMLPVVYRDYNIRQSINDYYDIFKTINSEK